MEETDSSDFLDDSIFLGIFSSSSICVRFLFSFLMNQALLFRFLHPEHIS